MTVYSIVQGDVLNLWLVQNNFLNTTWTEHVLDKGITGKYVVIFWPNWQNIELVWQRTTCTQNQNNVSDRVLMPSPALRGIWWNGISVFGLFRQLGQYWKKWGRLWATFEGSLFMFSRAKKIWKKHSVRNKKLLNTFLIFFLSNIFSHEKTVFLGLHKFSNLNILHKDLLMQDWVFRLGLCFLFAKGLLPWS